MTVELPTLYAYSPESMNTKINNLISLGHTKNEILKMTVEQPALYGYMIDTIIPKIENLVNNGYKKQEIISFLFWS